MNSWLLPMFFALLLLTAEGFWKNNPWGSDDEIGAANHITKQSVLQASRLIKNGKTYNLGIVVDANTPTFPPRSLSLTVVQPDQPGIVGVRGFGKNRGTVNDDVLYSWLGIGSQIDGLGHIGIGTRFYNGFNHSEFSLTTGLTKLGIEKLPPLVTRGVLLNMAAYYEKEIVDEGTAYTRRDIQRAARQQGVRIRKGDVVLFHSGWLNLLDGDNQNRARFIPAAPGLGISGARYLAETGIVAVGGDTAALEVIPPENPEYAFQIHQFLITRKGIYILENIDTRELAKNGVKEFMFILGVTRLRGAVQMMINPIAIH